MASVDLFGNPVKGDTHSALFNKLTGSGQGTRLTAKQQYKAELKKTQSRLDAIKYNEKLERIKNQNLRLSVAQAREQIKNPQIFERAKTKVSILQGFFK